MPSRKLGMIGLLACLCACAEAHTVYRPGAKSIEHAFSLAYVEFDDQGDFWEPDQVDRAIALIEETNRDYAAVTEAGAGGVFVVFLHGWRNNASPANERRGKLAEFKELLARLMEDERRNTAWVNANTPGMPPKPPRPIVGVYLAWRGDSLRTPNTALLNWLDIFTFWNRDSAATRIASRTNVSTALLRLLQTIRASEKAKVVVVGHSMGGLILERALSQPLADRIVQASRREERSLEPPADLIVMVNEAAPGLDARNLYATFDILKVSFGPSPSVDVPLLLSVTALNDRATRLAFPLGKVLGTAGQRFRKRGKPAAGLAAEEADCASEPGQRYLATRTAGHTCFLHSHRPLELEVTDQPCPHGIGSGYVKRCDAEPRGLAFSVEAANDDAAKPFYRHYTLRTQPGSVNDSPYWIFDAPKEVVDNHSGIFKDEFVEFIRGVVAVTGALRADTENRLYMAPASTVGSGAVVGQSEGSPTNF